jgi:wobble nucleotide-excising tRNase
MLLFDDPIQSMDDEHTESFKKTIVKDLLDRGLQVIVLTHMDNFAEDTIAPRPSGRTALPALTSSSTLPTPIVP